MKNLSPCPLPEAGRGKTTEPSPYPLPKGEGKKTCTAAYPPALIPFKTTPPKGTPFPFRDAHGAPGGAGGRGVRFLGAHP
jgi:hypothetical protein